MMGQPLQTETNMGAFVSIKAVWQQWGPSQALDLKQAVSGNFADVVVPVEFRIVRMNCDNLHALTSTSQILSTSLQR